MSEYELHYLISEVFAFQNSLFEYWLAISFAAIVAATYAADKFKVYLKLLAIGYFSASVYIFMSRVLATGRAQEYLTRIEQANYQLPSYMNGWLPTSTFIVDFSIFIIGSFTVLFYIFRVSRRE